ncbi:T9SS type B sorting domain-containing protein [Fibrella aquatilis]|uniref:Gliding motility-associated C-terminal domain-containing protein n=1 Tax=Fibrella aquatilis TaxID=2817059 RepID=A0A939G914_9BACT|nr:gliding motility-associated C-terminal domain-containing protein [Fibrella aquatilis]MBO0934066.1 gliding motility-associated C-terminal domain-containing protein [Fibrella aquatilis]
MINYALCGITFFAFLLPVAAHGQELIPNGGFELFDHCPRQDNLLSEARPWYNPNKATPDFYHTCFPTDQIELPPHSGQGLARLFMDAGWAEYLATPLKQPLDAGETYQLDMYVSSPTPNRYPVGSFGAYLSPQSLITATQKDLLLTGEKPQVIDNSPQRLTKRYSWEKVGGCYTAKGGESYLTIGNFVELPVTLGYYYLFIDDVSLLPVRLDLGRDTTLCGRRSTYLLNAKTPGATTYKWNTGSTAPTLLVAKPGTYWVEVVTPCKVLRDTITVKYQLDFSLGPDTTLCTGATLTLRLPTVGRWQDGSQQKNYEVGQSGRYTVQVSQGSCTVKDTIQVRYVAPPQLSLGPDKQLCGAETYTIQPTYAAGVFRWLDAFTDNQRTVSTSGVFRAAVTNDCATLVDSVTVDYSGCSCTIYAPDAFSPNADGLNDVFAPVACGDITMTALRVYNRWGELIFRTNSLPFSWDGTYRHQPCPAAVYHWQIDYIRQQPGKASVPKTTQNRLMLVY